MEQVLDVQGVGPLGQLDENENELQDVLVVALTDWNEVEEGCQGLDQVYAVLLVSLLFNEILDFLILSN